MPWDIQCPFDVHGHHSLKDAYAELFERGDGLQIAKGRAAMLCPIWGNPWRFPNGWFSNPVSGVGLPVFYWSKRIWDTYTDERKVEVRQRIPNVEQYLR
jgi:hypothetical protein